MSVTRQANAYRALLRLNPRRTIAQLAIARWTMVGACLLMNQRTARLDMSATLKASVFQKNLHRLPRPKTSALRVLLRIRCPGSAFLQNRRLPRRLRLRRLLAKTGLSTTLRRRSAFRSQNHPDLRLRHRVRNRVLQDTNARLRLGRVSPSTSVRVPRAMYGAP